jgi:molybdopterin biosynthesis enzyme
MRALTYLATHLITTAMCRSESQETVASLLSRSDAVVVAQLRHHGGICATGGIYAGEHFDVLTVLTGAVPDSSVTVGFQFKPGEPAIFPQIGEKMVLFLRAPTVPVKAFWSLIDVHDGAQPYSEALETTVRQLIAQQR